MSVLCNYLNNFEEYFFFFDAQEPLVSIDPRYSNVVLWIY